jgi:phosphopantothenate---cysteine ligase (ATP)
LHWCIIIRPYSRAYQLETDLALLIPKSRAALERYGHHLVIGNDLQRRKHEVVFVSREQRGTAAGDVGINWLRISGDAVNARGYPKEIEEDIIAELTKQHQAWAEGSLS